MQPIIPILFFSLFGNLGLMLSLIFGALILLRPLTNRLLRSRQRVLLWHLGWFGAVLSSLFGVLGLLPFHFTFRAFLSARTGGSFGGIPEFLPAYSGPGRYNLSLPGNTAVPVTLNDGAITAALLVYLAGILGVFLWAHSRKKRLRALEAGAEEVSLEDFGLEAPTSGLWGRYNVRVFLCSGLPTSYVRLTNAWGLITDNSVFLQRELPPERRTLVLRHELKHLELLHIYIKSYAHLGLYLFWWSPVVWLAFRLMCRDMELACDEAVLDGLDAAGRREYARTLAELGAGRPLWESAACFGECDAVLRVRRAAEYRQAVPWQKVLSWTALLLLFVFFFCGGPAGDGSLAADRPLQFERALSAGFRQGVTAPDGETYPIRNREPLRLTRLWKDPEFPYYYGTDGNGTWWRVALSWSKQEGEYLAIVFRLQDAPDTAELERVK